MPTGPIEATQPMGPHPNLFYRLVILVARTLRAQKHDSKPPTAEDRITGRDVG